MVYIIFYEKLFQRNIHVIINNERRALQFSQFSGLKPLS
jgi:hypothetical protein